MGMGMSLCKRALLVLVAIFLSAASFRGRGKNPEVVIGSGLAVLSVPTVLQQPRQLPRVGAIHGPNLPKWARPST
jgi:hypothetical protein